MKRLSLFFILSTAAMFFACTSGDNFLPGDGETPQTPEKPAVTPETPVATTGFDWSTQAHVDLTLTSEVETYVSIYSEPDHQKNSLLVEDARLEGNVARTFALAVPAGTEKLYVKYPAASGDDEFEPIEVNPSVGQTDVVDYKFPTYAIRSTYEKVPDFQYYYNSGVIMVEDMWPDFSASDADFNDLVMEYDLKTVECTTPNVRPEHGYKEGLIVTLDIRGVGSGQTRSAGLQLDFDTSLIESIETEVQLKAGQGHYEKVTDSRYVIDVEKHGDKLIILFDGLNNLVQGKHYQTTKGEIEVGKPMLRAYIKISGNPNRSAMTGDASREQAIAFRNVVSYTEKHDFFMVLKSGVEIHQKGFEPTYHYKNYAADSQGLMSEVPYCGKNNDVWVLRFPVGAPHVYDRVSIFSAYPQIREWIESTGQKNKAWYKYYDHDLVPRYW